MTHLAHAPSLRQPADLLNADIETHLAKLARIENAIANEPSSRRRRRLKKAKRFELDRIEDCEVENMRLEELGLDAEVLF